MELAALDVYCQDLGPVILPARYLYLVSKIYNFCMYEILLNSQKEWMNWMSSSSLMSIVVSVHDTEQHHVWRYHWPG